MAVLSDTVTILRTEYNRLRESQKVLRALQNAGVDNWEGYGFAMEDLQESAEEDEDDE